MLVYAMKRALEGDRIAPLDSYRQPLKQKRCFRGVLSNVSLNRLSDRSWRRRPVVPTSNGQINSGTHPTTHMEIDGGVLFAVVTVMERHDVRRRLRDS